MGGEESIGIAVAAGVGEFEAVVEGAIVVEARELPLGAVSTRRSELR